MLLLVCDDHHGMDDMRRIAFALFGLMFCFAANAAEMQPGDTPPDALGSALGGPAVTVSSLHGKVVVISFWATWCGYCMKEMPVLAGLQAVATQRGLPSFAVQRSATSRVIRAAATFMSATRRSAP